MEPPEKIRQHLIRLGKTIEQLLSASEEVKKILHLIHKEGYNVRLGFVTMVTPLGEKKPLKFELTEWDKNFLRNIGIEFNETNDSSSDD